MDFIDSNINLGVNDSIFPIGEEEMIGYSFDDKNNSFTASYIALFWLNSEE